MPMNKRCIALAVGVSLNALIAGSRVTAGNTAYDKAVADYTAGKYGQAASEFETLKISYPTNALCRYYLALTRQALGHFDKAKEEYQWVATNGDARLRAMALQGMQRMGKTKSFVPSSSTTSSAASTAAASARAAATQTNTHGGSTVRTILKFTAPWCATCQKFAPNFNAVKSKFNDISFEDVDFDSSPDLRAKYNVSQTPHLVFLDSSGKVLFSRMGAPQTADSFERLVRSYH